MSRDVIFYEDKFPGLDVDISTQDTSTTPEDNTCPLDNFAQINVENVSGETLDNINTSIRETHVERGSLSVIDSDGFLDGDGADGLRRTSSEGSNMAENVHTADGMTGTSPVF